MKSKKTGTRVMAVLLAGVAVGLSPIAHADLSANQVYEIDFMNSMIDHHAMATQMAALCPGRATHSELLAMCQDIQTTQMQEIKKMQAWMRQWYCMSSKPHMVEHAKVDIDHLASLSGAEFEKEFMEMMAGHHMVAIEQAAPCLVRASHGELISMCEDIATSQAGEIKKMRSWLCSWNSICSLHFGRSALVGKPEEMTQP